MDAGRRLVTAACFMITVLFAVPSAFAVLYKWTDANGRVVYGDTPPPGVKSERLKAAVAPANPDAVRDLANKDLELRKRTQQRTEDDAKAKKAEVDAKQKTDSCVQARGRLRSFREEPNLYRYNEKGEKIYYDAAERQKAITETEKFIRDANCPPAP